MISHMDHATETAETFLPTRSSLLINLRTLEDTASWQEFFDTYQRSIFGLAMKCGLSRAEAEEVVQETMVTVARKMPEFKYDRALGSFKGWLFTITRRAVRKQLRRRRSRNELESSPDAIVENEAEELDASAEVADPTVDFAEQWEEDWRLSLLDMAIDRVRRRIKPKQFQMFDLYVKQQRPMADVTRILNVNAAQVYMAKLRVSGAIRSEMAQLQQKLI
jgi:RNA polymerase sigma-70 factor (ECF subfamily)